MVRSTRYDTDQAPALAFDRAWSAPGLPLAPEKRIAVTLARPTFRDIVRLCRAYGVDRVRGVLESLASNGDVGQEFTADWRHRLDNIARGFDHAASRLPSG